jgi:hypothetical protein
MLAVSGENNRLKPRSTSADIAPVTSPMAGRKSTPLPDSSSPYEVLEASGKTVKQAAANELMASLCWQSADSSYNNSGFKLQRLSRDKKDDSMAGFRHDLIASSDKIAIQAPNRIFRDKSHPDLIGYENNGSVARTTGLDHLLASICNIVLRQGHVCFFRLVHQVVNPESEAVHYHHICTGIAAYRSPKIHGLFYRCPIAQAPGIPVTPDAFAHFIVNWKAGRYERPGAGHRFRQFL